MRHFFSSIAAVLEDLYCAGTCQSRLSQGTDNRGPARTHRSFLGWARRRLGVTLVSSLGGFVHLSPPLLASSIIVSLSIVCVLFGNREKVDMTSASDSHREKPTSLIFDNVE